MSRALETRSTEDWGSLERLRLKRALTLDSLPGIASNPAVPEGGLVRALAAELGCSVEELLAAAGVSTADEALEEVRRQRN